MNNTCNKCKSLILLLIAFTGVFFISCGLETIITVTTPSKTNHKPLYTTDDYTEWYLSFDTCDTDTGSGVSFTGTEIYYKIFCNTSSMNSVTSTVDSMLNSTSNPSTFDYIINQSFQELRCGVIYEGKYIDSGFNIFVPPDELSVGGRTNYSVLIRPKSYQSGDHIMNRASVAIPYGKESAYDDKEVYNYLGYDPATKKIVKYKYVKSTEKWFTANGTEIEYKNLILLEPRRNITVNDKYLSFDLFDDMETKDTDVNAEPKEGDVDFKYETTRTEDDTYYVQFFAVNVVWDSGNVVSSQSQVLDLGSIPIKKGK